MKKIIVLLFLALFIAASASSSHAYYEEYKANIKDGLGTMVKSPIMLVDSVKEEVAASEFKPFGLIGGALKGGYHTIKEFGTGAYRVLTFNMGEDNSILKYFRRE